jgi:lipopolysaccharide transport system ATP-binding protein
LSDIAIHISGLSKLYKIGKLQRRHDTLRDRIADTRLFNLFKRRNGSASNGYAEGSVAASPHLPVPASDVLWALKDVSFEVKRGEVVGIIGRNGAGKSTLLKILSRITEPTEGYADITGRVASLLEVGTGFHPELTGRENIYLNGSILGMKRAEINKRFDEIVAFAEIEKFIDTPVKRYSSGMYVRLAFAVAAHLETEILLVDEVLAVGDAAFQKKCLGKMGDVAKRGRTVLFVSHNLAAVNNLCRATILLDGGCVKQFDESSRVIGYYLADGLGSACSIDLTDYRFRDGNRRAAFEWAELRRQDGEPCQDFSIGDDVEVLFRLRAVGKLEDIKLAVELRTSDGLRICNMTDSDSGFELLRPDSSETVAIMIKDIRLYPDTYYLSLWAGSTDSRETFDRVEDCLCFNIADGGRLTMRRLPRSAGLLFLTPQWNRLSSAQSSHSESDIAIHV